MDIEEETNKLSENEYESINEESISEDLNKEISRVNADVVTNLKDGCLLLVRVGSEKAPATKDDIDHVSKTLYEMFRGELGINILVVTHNIQIEKISLPTLRNIQSKVVNSWNKEQPVVMNMEDGLGFLGDFE